MTEIVSREAPASALYRAVWRWHFYAGLIVLPFMILLAVTGGIYLFKDEINDFVLADLRLIEPAPTPQRPASQLLAAALAVHPGTVKSYAPSPASDRSAEIKIVSADGITKSVYVDPYSARVLGSAWDGGSAGSELMWIVRKLHSLEIVGWLGNRIIEAVAGWAVLLVATGVYLWWPRGRQVATFKLRRIAGRAWWRDLHAVTGIYTAVFIVFLAFSGLPWSGYWGGKFYDIAYTLGLGMPDGYWSNAPASTIPTDNAIERTPWILQEQPMPLSGAASGVPAHIDRVVATVEERGIHAGYALNMPRGPQGVFTASVYPDDITQERVIHLDQYTGEVLFDMGLADLGGLGMAAEWGISLHMGQAFGLTNQIVLALASLGIVVLAASGITMWWKRRPSGSFGAPAVAADWRIPRTVLVMALVAGLFFPLVGLSLLIVLGLETAARLATRLKPA